MAGRSKWGSESRHARGYGTKWNKIRKVILKRDQYLCQQCKANGRITPLCVKPYDHAVDHIIPKSQGGDDRHSNLRSLCAPCHDAKSAEEARVGQGVAPRPTFDADGRPEWD